MFRYGAFCLKSFKAYNNNQTARLFIPCFRRSDNVIGLYDLCGSICPLTGTPFYINSGTGAFTKGANKTELVKCDLVRGVGEFSQLVKNGNFVNTSEWVGTNCTPSASSGIMTMTSTNNGTFGISQSVPDFTNTTHKYLIAFEVKSAKSVRIRYPFIGTFTPQNNTWNTFSLIYSGSLPNAGYFYIQFDGTSVGDVAQVTNVNIFDLTSLFGSGDEPTTYAEARQRILQKYHIDIANYVPYGTQMVIERCNIWHDLPRAYQRVEYIESHGTEYVDTRFKPNNNSGIEVTAQYVSVPDYNSLIDARNFASYDYFGFQAIPNASPAPSNERLRMRCLYNANIILSPSGQSVLDKHTYALQKNKCYFDNELIAEATSSAFQVNYNLIMFARNIADAISNFSIAKMYDCKIFDNDVLIRHFIPCYRKSDNVIGLYDTIEDKFYINQGTGTFGKGADVN